MIETFEKGALVKCWNGGETQYAVGRFKGMFSGFYIIEDKDFYVDNYFDNAIEIPAELAKPLEELGKRKQSDIMKEDD